jgi:hypothetical protein
LFSSEFSSTSVSFVYHYRTSCCTDCLSSESLSYDNIITSTDDCKCLQQSLTNLNCWSVQNNVRFNASKCKVLTITRKKTHVTYDYKLEAEKSINSQSACSLLSLPLCYF